MRFFLLAFFTISSAFFVQAQLPLQELLDTARVAIQAGDFRSSEQQYLNIAWRGIEEKEFSHAVEAYSYAHFSSIRLGKKEAAQTYLDSAFIVWEMYKVPDLSYTLALENRGLKRYYTQQLDDALEDLTLSYQIHKTIPERKLGIINILQLIAGVYTDKGLHDQSKEYTDLAEQELEQNFKEHKHYLKAKEELYTHKGVNAYFANRLAESNSSFAEALRIAKIAYPENHSRIAICLSNASSTEESNGNYLLAQKMLDEAIRIHSTNEGTQNSIIADYYGRLSNCYMRQFDYEKAIEFATLAKNTKEYMYDETSLETGLAYINLIELKLRANKLNGIDTLFEKANFHTQNTKLPIRVKYLQLLAEYENTKDNPKYNTIKDHLLSAFELSTRINKNPTVSQASILIQIAEIEHQFNNLKAATNRSKQAIDIIKKSSILDEREPAIRALLQSVGFLPQIEQTEFIQFILQHCFWQPDEWDKTLESIRPEALALPLEASQAMMLYADNANQLNKFSEEEVQEWIQKSFRLFIDTRTQYTSESSKIRLSNKGHQLADRALSILYEQHKKNNMRAKELAFTIAELSKSLTLAEHVRQLDFSSAFDDSELFKQLKSIDQQLISTRYEIQTTENIKPEILRELRLRLLQLAGKRSDLLEKIQTEFPNLKSAISISNENPLDILNNTLGDKELLISYFISDSNCHVFNYLNGIINWKTEQSKGTVDVLPSLLPTLSDPTSKYGNGRILGALYNRLLPTQLLDSNPSIQRIIIIPDGILSQFPFELLISNDQYLIENYPISYEYSTVLLKRNREKTQYKTKNWIGFAPFSESSLLQFSKLPSSIRELKSLEKLSDGKSFAAKKATKQSFLKQYQSHQFIHLATHADIHPSQSLLSQLLFSGDSTDIDGLSLAELYSLQFKADHLYLGACQSGDGILQQGEGIMSLARGCFYAGVPRVVFSQWPLFDEASADITKTYYQLLADGMAADKALQQAKIQYLKTGSRNRQHPAYWAGITLSGNPNALEVRGSSSSFTTILLVCAAGFVALFILFFIKKNK